MQAVLLGSVALGALYCGDADTAAGYMDESRSHVRDCFDAVLPETVACFVLLVLYFLQSLDNERVFRYMGFAQQAFAELSPQVRAVTHHSVTETVVPLVSSSAKLEYRA
jgi:hypothetical protein